jgi:hypothetical protein
MVTANQELRRFTMQFLETLGASLSLENRLLRVELTSDQLAQLEGRTGPRPFWEIERDEQTVLYLAFDQESAETDHRAELVCPGSYRLEQMLASTHRLGRLARFTLLPEKDQRPSTAPHRTYLLFHFRVAYEGQWKHEQLIDACVDMTNGCIRPDLSRLLDCQAITTEIPTNIDPRTIEITEAWRIACGYVTQALSKQDDGWARESLLAMAQERCILERFFPDDESFSDDSQHLQHLSELRRRAQPRALARTRLAAMIFAQRA